VFTIFLQTDSHGYTQPHDDAQNFTSTSNQLASPAELMASAVGFLKFKSCNTCKFHFFVGSGTGSIVREIVVFRVASNIFFWYACCMNGTPVSVI
jgi:hypothetical protein